MIISRTPLRISLVGGGTDLESFYSRAHGAVVSFAINKYVYVIINDKFDGRLRLSYSQTENVDDVSELKHDLVRSCLEMYKIKTGLEIVSVADIPGGGTGLGSSSSFTVGLIRALEEHYNHRIVGGFPISTGGYAEVAYEVEKRAGHYAGKQDQYAAAYGGINLIEFTKRSVRVTPIHANIEKISQNFSLYYTGITRSADAILKEQSKAYNDEEKFRVGIEMARMARKLKEDLEEENPIYVGHYLHENWMLKKQLHGNISNPKIDQWYEKARNAGAIGGKLCGAGGGGFLLFYAHPENHAAIESALGLRRVDFRIDPEGSKVIYRG